jgi:UDP-2,3-diacylglucosamine hydrolase
MWVGDDDDSSLAAALCETLRLTTRHTKVFVMHGNRDFLLGAEFVKRTGVNLLQDPHRTGDGLLLSHGDMLCTDDHDYQAMRATLRSSEWQQEMLARPLAARQAFGASLRAQSRASNANKSNNIMDVNEGAVCDWLDDGQVLIHGHTHRPGMHQVATSRGGAQRWVLGAWERCGWLVRQRDQQLQLECFTLARRYET